jgi:hypothetical protein
MVTGIELLLVAKKIAIIAVLGAAAWGFLRDYISRVIVPVIRDHISPALASAFLTVLKVLDDVKCLADRAVVAAFVKARDMIKDKVLRAETLYRKTSPTTVQATNVLYTADGDAVRENRFEAELKWHDVPPNVKEYMMKNENTAIRTSLTEELFEAVNKKVSKEMLL